ncbi:zinc finger CCCH domain-containing protein 53-like isoform X2 [Phoenix dactylifera]|uniref:Zinc finger CCCH domain-containing protein 53-like isoform X2 n=1 Tax=Phoenix dactylifera TaxID=42345 RepID=A0A8B9A198_PHODC|nr:zinc finger CCCH domain-containing protein 53-like isoform X2 [Phoenix dactylifera]
MDAYEATRIVFSRIQSLDPENAAKIMGLLLIQDHGEKEMIRLAFGPEALVHSVVLKARKDLGLVPPSTPATPSAAVASPSPFLLPRQNSTRLGLAPPPPLSVSSPSSWAPPPVFSRTNSNGSALNGSADDVLVQNPADELISPCNPVVASPFHGAGDLIDEFQLQDQLSFLNDAQVSSPLPMGSKSAAANDLFYQDVECRSPSGDGNGMLYPYGVGWGANGHHRRSCSVTDLCLGADPTGTFGWKPCLYFARGYCKNGSACRFLHGLPDDAAVTAAAVAAGSKMDAVVEQQCQELLLRSKSQRLGGASQLMASAFPYSPTVSVPPSPSSSSKCLNFLLQQQQNESQRAAAAAALMLGGDESHKFIGRSRMERSDFAGMVNPASRQIYLTFPADSTFREEDVSNYFSIYGPVQDVRIPYQQKRMFGFVTFVYPETVKLILAKGNPHFVCDARVLVKPYKEKGKVPDKYRKQQQQAERGDFSGCTTPTGLDSRDPYDLQQLARMLYNSTSSQELLLRRKLEEQQQAAELQQAIELQNRRFMGLQLLDLKTRSLSSSMPTSTTSSTIATPPTITIPALDSRSNGGSQEDSPSEGSKSFGEPPGAAPDLKGSTASHGLLRQTPVNAADKEESPGETTPNGDSDFQESAEHNLPDSPFASPTKTSFTLDSFSAGEADNLAASAAATASYIGTSNSSSSSNNHLFTSTLLPATSTLDMATFKSCLFQMPRFSSGHGAIGM